MAGTPHWADQIFSASNENPDDVAQRLTQNPRFKAAIAAGLKAMKESEEKFRKTPKLMAPGPNQDAGKAFLKSLSDP